jgi:hypothetical protein
VEAPGDASLVLAPTARVVGRVHGHVGFDRRVQSVRLGDRRSRVDANGGFAFEPVPPIRNVRVEGAGAKSPPFDVAPGTVVHVDLRSAVARIIGVVRDEAGARLAGAVVTMLGGFDQMRAVDPSWYGSAETDHAGRYTITVFVHEKRWLEPAATRAGFARGTTKNFAIRAGETKTVDFTLRPGLPLRGRVVDASGRPVRHAGVGICWRASTHTDADGRFAFEHLAPGSYEVGISGEGFRYLTVEAEAGGPEVLITVPGSSVIEGVLLEADGRPAEGFGSVDTDGRSGWIGPGGRFRLAGLRPGAYDLEVGPHVFPGIETGSEDVILRLPPD